MKLSTSGSSGGSQQGSEGGENKCLNSELWHACAGPLVCLPTAGTRVVYFPQGHSEQVSATTNKDVDGHIPNYPNLPPQLICQLHNVTMHADVETDEVYAQITLQPLSPQEQKDLYIPMELGCPSRQPTNYFCKTLTASDTSTHGGFSVPRRAAEKVFPPLDYTLQPPCQELIARDLHDVEWKFRHIFRGQPKRHLLTTGWSVFVSAKRLVAGDSVLFIWNEKNQLFLGIRRATRPQNVMPSSVLSSDSMHIGLLAAAAHAAATNSCFTIFYNPRACPSEFVIPLSKYVKAVFHTRVSVGMRFRMLFETEESSVRRYMGTITGISDLDSVRWPNSHWRSVKVGWDESTAGDRQPRVSLWEIEPLTTFPMYPSLFPLRLKRPWHAGASPMQGNLNDPTNSLMWLRGDNNVEGLNSASFQSMGMLPWMQPQADQFLPMSNQNQLYQSMLSSQLQSLRSAPGDPLTAQLLQIQQPFSQQLQQSTGNIPFLQQQQQHQQRLQSVSQQMLPVHPQISKDGTSLQQQSHPLEFYKQQEASSSSQQQEQLHAPPQESFQLQNSERLIQGQRQQHLVGGINHSSHLKSELVGFNSELSTPHSTVATEILGSAGGPHVSTFNHSQMSEQPVLAQHNLMNSSYSQFNAFANTVSLPPCPGGKDGSSPLESGNMGLDLLRHYHHQPPAPHHSTLNTNVDSSGLILPMTMPSNHHSSSSGDEGMCSAALGVYPSNMLDGIGMVNSPELHSGRQGDLLPPMNPVFVKVYKTGSVGRSLDISRFSSYDELREELGRMFGIEGKLENPQRSGWQLVFVDRENDILLLGDDPWESFVSNVWSIKILSPEDVLELGKQVTESLG